MTFTHRPRVLLINAPQDFDDWRDSFCQHSGLEMVNVRSLEQLVAELRSAPRHALVGTGAQDVEPLTAMCTIANSERRCPIVLLADRDHSRLHRLQISAQEVGVTFAAALRGPFEGPRLARALARIDRGDLEPTAAELRRGLDELELALHFQPKFECAGGARRIVSLEALVRWEHPELGLLLPGRFLPLARSSGLLLELTDFTLMESIHQVALWRERKLDITAAVNLGTELLRDRLFGDRLLSYLRQFDVPPERLILEVQEAPSLADRRVYADVLTMLRIEGMGLALDDFGTGYSSLTELYRSPFTEVKLDSSLVADATRSPQARAVLRSMIGLAADLSMAVCAESVETRAMLEFLVAQDCDLAQGNFLCEPRTLFDLEPLLNSQGKLDGDACTARAQPAYAGTRTIN